MTTAPLQCHRLSVTHYGATHACPTDVSFTLEPGEALLVLGPSGCGKSTLALSLNGLIPKSIPAQQQGHINLGDKNLADLPLPQATSQIAMVFQDAAAQLVAETVFAEVAFGPENLLLPTAEVSTRVEQALRAVNLWQARHDPPESLSGGQQQRLVIAAAMAMQPTVLVLDEPTANLDTRSAAQVYEVLDKLRREHKTAMVLIEHNLEQALRIATRVLVLNRDGHPVLEGSPQKILVDSASELKNLGVWLPIATELGERLRTAGVPIPKLPLTVTELRNQLILAKLTTQKNQAGPKNPSNEIKDSRAHEAPIMLESRGLTVSKNTKPILTDVSISIPQGSFTALIGPNGAGKSTLLHNLTAIDNTPRGCIYLDGQDITKLPERQVRKRIGVVFQNPEQQFLTTRVWDELAIELKRQHLTEDEISSRVTAWLKRVDLIEQAQQHPFLLSGGQKRRLSVATALVSGANILVLDEPTFGQDQARARELVTMLQELRTEGTTVLIATHDLQLAVEEATQLLILERGKLVASGPPAKIIREDAFSRVGLGLPPVAAALHGLPEPLGTITRMCDIPEELVWQ